MLRLENPDPVPTGQLLCSGRNRGSLPHRSFQMESHRAPSLFRSLTKLGWRTSGFLPENPQLCSHHQHPHRTSSHGLSRSPPLSLWCKTNPRSDRRPPLTSPRNPARVELHDQATNVELFLRAPLAPKRARLVFVRETGICECNRPFQEKAGRSPKSKACFLLVTSSTSRLKPARLLSTLLLISLLEAAVVGRGCLKAKKAH